MKIADKYAPLRKFTVRANSAPWIDDEIRKAITLKDDVKLLELNQIIPQTGLITKNLEINL